MGKSEVKNKRRLPPEGIASVLLSVSAFLFFRQLPVISCVLPPTCVHWQMLPSRSDLVAVYTVGRIICIFPWEACTFQVRHHSQVTSVLRSDTCYAVV